MHFQQLYGHSGRRPTVYKECLSNPGCIQKVKISKYRYPSWLGSWSPYGLPDCGNVQEVIVSVCRECCLFDGSDQVSPYQETKVFLWLVRTVRNRSPKCPFFRCSSHLSWGTQGRGTNELRCNQCREGASVFLCRTRDLQVWPCYPWLVYFLVWYPYGKCLCDA